MGKKKSEFRYIVTDVVSIPVCRIGSKGEAYKTATKPGWGVVEWYSAINNYKVPVNRDMTDTTQTLNCDEDSSATLYPKYGRAFCITPYNDVIVKNIPKQAEVEAIIISDSCGFSFWEHEKGDVKIFVTYDVNGLIDTYRLENWADKPIDGETEITFEDLQSEEEHQKDDRAGIVGTFEYDHKAVNRNQTGTASPYPHNTEEAKMRNLYEYKGSISSISGSGEIVLYVFGNDEIPPTRLTVPKALFQYISDVSGADSEEKYYEKIFKYDSILNLHEIVIPSKDNGVPAKIITQSKLTSEKAAIFGEVEQMETPENELEPMSNEEYNRYFEFRREHNHDKFYYA